MFDAIFLDCDGVVTDKRARVDSKVMFEAYRLAHSGKKVAFVTGRSVEWLARSILPQIDRFNPTPAEKARFFFVAECGNRWLSFSGAGFARGSDDSSSVPWDVRAEIKGEAKQFGYLFFDETKESLVSLEIRHDKLVSPSAEREAQQQLDDAREHFASRYPQFIVVKTLYAVDVMGKGVGKASAARRALELMGSVSEAIAIGDSEIDLEMGGELARNGVRFKFYYVGETPPPKQPFEVKRTEGKYAEGTLEVLRDIR